MKAPYFGLGGQEAEICSNFEIFELVREETLGGSWRQFEENHHVVGKRSQERSENNNRLVRSAGMSSIRVN